MLRSSNFYFFWILSLNFWLVPLIPYEDPGEVFTDSVFGFTLLAAAVLQGLIDRRYRPLAVIAAVVILAAISLEELMPHAAYVENATFAICAAAATFLYFHTMTLSLEDVTFDTVFAAACAYILIGMFFASVYGLVLEVNPAAFAPDGSIAGRYDLLYYSFATLTTLGAADILPVSDVAKMLTVFQAMMGLIYIAILVGSIVGAFSAGIAARQKRDE